MSYPSATISMPFMFVGSLQEQPEKDAWRENLENNIHTCGCVLGHN